MKIFAADDPLVLQGVYDEEGYRPLERARIAKAKAQREKEAQQATEKDKADA